MQQFADPPLQHQEQANAYFQDHSGFWKQIYASSGVYAEIHKERHAMALNWIDSLTLPANARVLEIGCGAGLLAVDLARRGLRVQAIDAVKVMVEQARQYAEMAGVSAQLSLSIGDACNLAFADASFDLVIALGVIPWLEHPEVAIGEMARVTKAGGQLLLTADNRGRLVHLLDPWQNPMLAPLKRRIKNGLIRLGLRQVTPHVFLSTFHSLRFIDSMLARAHLQKVRGKTLGFGPFTFRNRKIFPEPLATGIHHQLQSLADRNVPIVRSTGAQYLVLVKKPL